MMPTWTNTLKRLRTDVPRRTPASYKRSCLSLCRKGRSANKREVAALRQDIELGITLIDTAEPEMSRQTGIASFGRWRSWSA